MFDQVKVNQNSILNLLKIPERENPEYLTKKNDNDFFSMVMEKTGYEDKKSRIDNKSDQTSEPLKNNEKIEPLKNDQNDRSAESSRLPGKNEREENLHENEKSNAKENVKSETKDEIKQEPGNKEIKKGSEVSVKEVKGKKNNSKDSEEEINLLNQIHAESNIKNLMEVIKAAFSGNKKAESDNFQKLFSNLKPEKDKEKTNFTSSFKKNDTDKTQKNFPELVNSITRDLKESISREIFKSVENRKPGSKPQILNDKELKELASNIIDGIKKNKAKEIVKHEARTVLNDDLRIEKKNSVSIDDQPMKKIVTSEDSSSEKNGAKDKNSGKESFSYNGGKIDFSAKSGLEKMEHSLKTSDFKDNLQEIIDKAKVTVRDSKNGTFTVRLNPQELGNVNVNLIMENGVITGKFLVDNEDVKSMLLNSLNDLKYQLEEAGIAVGEFSVNVEDQREKYLKQKDNESSKALTFMNSDRDVIAAADQYNSNSAAHTGHINMVI